MHKELGLKEGELRDSYKLADIEKIVDRYLMPYWRAGTIYAFNGEIGAGKTTMLKVLLQRAGVEAEIISPTYAYYCEYLSSDDTPIYHFDLSRVDSIQTFCEIGFDFLIKDQKNVVVIEWPGVIDVVLREQNFSDRVVWVNLGYALTGSNHRLFTVSSLAKKNESSLI